MAWRNVWRNTRRSSATIGAMTLALWVMLLHSGLVKGYYDRLERGVVDLEMGDIQIFAPTYQDNPSLFTTIPNSEEVTEAIENSNYPASPRLLGGGLGASGKFSAGVALRGIELERDRKVSLLPKMVGEGQWLNQKFPLGVVIGKKLARTLNARVGSELVVLTQAADGSMANELFDIRGILETISDATDRRGVIMLASSFRELMVFPEGVHQIVVRRPDDIELTAATAAVRKLAPDMDVQSWRQILPTIATMLDGARASIFILYLVIYLAVGILLLNAMLMAVFERIREFGVLKAIGAGPAKVFSLIFSEAIIQMALSTALGTILALPPMWYLSEVGINLGSLGGMSMMGMSVGSVLYSIYSVETVVPAYTALTIIVLLSVLYPALKAAWIKPIESMRYQ